METKSSKLAAVALIYGEEGKILGVSRKDDKTLFGLPGGKVDQGESMEEAMRREVFEETGLIINDCSPLFIREDGEYVAAVYLIHSYSGEIETKEAGVVEWIDFDRLKSGAFSEYNSALEAHIEKLSLFFKN
jgi:8-oxo-dGTP diphosphatase